MCFFATVNKMWLLPASNYCRTRGDQIVKHSSDDKTLLGRSRKPGEAAENLIDGGEKRICWLSFEFQSPHVIWMTHKIIPFDVQNLFQPG